MTVSRALNSHPQVRDETRRKVLEKAAELNYRPNLWARSMVTRRSHILGLVVPDISHSFYAEITGGIQEVIEDHGYNLLLCNTHRNPKTEAREIDALLAARVDGLIIASEQPEDNWRYYYDLQQQGIRFVLIDRFFPKLNCSCLTTDDFEAGRLATQHLLDLGHRRIAHLKGSDISPARLRLEGYQHALRDAGVELNPAWIVPGNFRLDESRNAMKFLMSLQPRPTAVVAGNDNSAFGAVQACREMGLSVPRDVSVVGIGNVEGDHHPNPFLTTVHWDRSALGREAGRVLLDEILGPKTKAPVKKVFPPQLLVRQSTSPPRS